MCICDESTSAFLGYPFEGSAFKELLCRLPLPDWLPPSYKGVSARYGHQLKATVKFTGTPTAMQQLTKHLSLDVSRRVGGGSLLRLATNPSQARSAMLGRKEPAVAAELTADAKVALLVLPNQVHTSLLRY